MDRRPQRSVEQIEVIEHRIVEEGRRPVGAAGRYLCTFLRATHRLELVLNVTSAFQALCHRIALFDDRRNLMRREMFRLIGGQQIEVTPTRSQLYTTGAGLDTSGSRLYTSGQHLDTSGSRLNTSGQRVDFGDISGNTVVNQYGYDVHENILGKCCKHHEMRGRAFVRKDSYRKMQQSDELMGSQENSKSYAKYLSAMRGVRFSVDSSLFSRKGTVRQEFLMPHHCKVLDPFPQILTICSALASFFTSSFECNVLSEIYKSFESHNTIDDNDTSHK
ncbi:hypothetical protein ANCCEY_09159 [Ancylostoma ceylanicum]|uniref:Uncharacterized protein n=1 Tax=Ancylostoma ceylanicum TaxID=53326 RepID=A0A0D6LVT8_9BILA|nr:hypothetical protein ANCCEY_09159 [Ancylostoma ceylanicum]